MSCGNCGAEIGAGDFYCRKCGSSLKEGESNPVYTPRHVTLRREMTVLGLGLLLIAGVAFSAWYALFYERSPAMVVQRFMDADMRSQFSRQPPMLIDRWDSGVILSAFQAIRQKTGSSPFQNVRVLGSNENGNTAYVNVELAVSFPPMAGANVLQIGTAPQGATRVPFAFVLQSENGHWKIDGAQTLLNASGAFAAAGYLQLSPLMTGLPKLAAPNGVQLVPPAMLAPQAPPNGTSGSTTF